MLRKCVSLLKNHLSTKFPDVNVGFYLIHRSNFVHLGLDVPLYSLKNYSDFVKEIHKFHSRYLDSNCFQLVEPPVVLTIKWKFDYIILREKKWILLIHIPKYVPQYVPDNLKWYERDSLLTWYYQCKCEDFLRNTDAHFKEAKTVNFDIIHGMCKGEEVPKKVFKQYQTVGHEDVLKYPETKENKIFPSAFRTDRKGIFWGIEVLRNILGKKL